MSQIRSASHPSHRGQKVVLDDDPRLVRTRGVLLASMPTAINATSSETILMTGAIDANLAASGWVWSFKAFGNLTAGSAQYRVRIGNTGTLADTTAWTSVVGSIGLLGAGNQRVGVDGLVTLRVTGASGSVNAEGQGWFGADGLPTLAGAPFNIAVNTTQRWYITVSAGAWNGTLQVQGGMVYQH